MSLILSALKFIGGHIIAFTIECLRETFFDFIFTPVKIITEIHTQAKIYSSALTIKPVKISF